MNFLGDITMDMDRIPILDGEPEMTFGEFLDLLESKNNPELSDEDRKVLLKMI